MSKTKLRKEYEAAFGVVKGTLRLYDASGNVIYRDFSDGLWFKYQYDPEGNMTSRKDSDDGWCKYQYDASGNETYREDSVNGVTLDKGPCSAKVFIEEQTGKKFKMTEIK